MFVSLSVEKSTLLLIFTYLCLKRAPLANRVLNYVVYHYDTFCFCYKYCV